MFPILAVLLFVLIWPPPAQPLSLLRHSPSRAPRQALDLNTTYHGAGIIAIQVLLPVSVSAEPARVVGQSAIPKLISVRMLRYHTSRMWPVTAYYYAT